MKLANENEHLREEILKKIQKIKINPVSVLIKINRMDEQSKQKIDCEQLAI